MTRARSGNDVEVRDNTGRGRSKTTTHAGGHASGNAALFPPVEKEPTTFPNDGVIQWVRQNIYGHGVTIPGPFGPKPRRYFDYTASGLPFKPIEELLQKQVLPYMSNTHSTSSHASEIINRQVEAAHEKVRHAVHGTEDDVIVFTGSGATGAVNKLIGVLGLRIPESLNEQYKFGKQIPPEQRPIVLLTRMEHHSNDLPWRESICDIEYIGYDEHGRANWRDVDRILSQPEYRDRPLKIGSFSAASNVTGVLNDTKLLAQAMHNHGGFVFFDFAAAGPYVTIDMHPDDKKEFQKDAIFVSMHKFTGGPQSPGLLIANKSVFAGRAPAEPGGGTVLYTSPWEYRYVDDLQQREESGTPAIVNVIRAGLAFDLKSEVTVARLMQLEHHCVTTATAAWRDHPRITILGPDPMSVPRLGILSIIIDKGNLHHNLAVKLLNDLYGIQVRGGCMCAGTYGHDLLQITKQHSKSIRDLLDDGEIIKKPGWVRISFGPGVTPEDFETLLEAVPHLADHWQEYLPDYELNEETAEWRHKREAPVTAEVRLRMPDILKTVPVPPMPSHAPKRLAQIEVVSYDDDCDDGKLVSPKL